MNIKYILSSIVNEAAALGATGELQAGVRLTGAVNKERGEGYLLLYEDGLVLLYRRLGQRDYEGCWAAPEEWNFENYREEKYALLIDMRCREAVYSCEFTPAERDAAEVIFNAIVSAHSQVQTLYSESTLVMTALLYMLSGDGHEEYAESLLGKPLFRAGRRYAADRELQDLVARGAELFSREQKECVLINLIEQRMSDDLWSSTESSALRELAGVWDLGDDFFEQSCRVLLMRRRIGGLFKN